MEITDDDLEAILDRTRGEAVLTDQEKNKKRLMNSTVSNRNNSNSSSGDNNASITDQVNTLKRKMPVNSPHKKGHSNSQYLQEGQQCTAADFEESAPMISLRIFDGKEFLKKKFSNKEIIADWGKRERTSRLTEMHVPGVGLMRVLKSNMYSLEEGEPSVFEKETTSKVLEAKANGEEQRKSKRVSSLFLCVCIYIDVHVYIRVTICRLSSSVICICICLC